MKRYAKPTKPNQRIRRRAGKRSRALRSCYLNTDTGEREKLPLRVKRLSANMLMPIGVVIAPLKNAVQVGPYVRDGNRRWWIGAPSSGVECEHPRVLKKLRKAVRRGEAAKRKKAQPWSADRVQP